jgi:hypothetical protein
MAVKINHLSVATPSGRLTNSAAWQESLFIHRDATLLFFRSRSA